jgi:DNA-binding MarR family transcriptional regulator
VGVPRRDDGEVEAEADRTRGLPPSMRDRVPFLIYRAAEASMALANAMLSVTTLTARQVGILTMIIEFEPMTQKALGDALRIDRNTMVSLVDDLEAKAFAVRERHPFDRRAYLVVPTDAGRAAKIAAVRVLDQQQERFLAPLAPDERDQLAHLLRKLYTPPS